MLPSESGHFNPFHSYMRPEAPFFGVNPMIGEASSHIPEEVERVGLELGTWNGQDFFYVQRRYLIDTPFPVASWQENDLMLAELQVRSGGTQEALLHVNRVRSHHSLPALTSISIDVVMLERQKELWGTGLRLLDQRRLDKWHLGPGTWQYFNIPESERTLNPNF
jgi:hypothetical protein